MVTIHLNLTTDYSIDSVIIVLESSEVTIILKVHDSQVLLPLELKIVDHGHGDVMQIHCLLKSDVL